MKDFFANFKENQTIEIDYLDLETYCFDVADTLHSNPDQIIKTFVNVLNGMNTTDVKMDKPIQVRFINYSGDILKSLRDLRSDKVGKLIRFDGLVKRKREILPRVSVAVFECRGCMRIHTVIQKTMVLSEPTVCKDCGNRAFHLLDDQTEWSDYQSVIVQEPLDVVRGRDVPREMELMFEHDLVDRVTPGEQIRITGVLKVERKNKQMKYIVDVNNIQKLEKEFEDIELTPDEIDEIVEMSTKPGIFNSFSNSIAPTVQGYDDIKKALALQLFEGTTKEFNNGSRKRGAMHILLVGDPGMAKSEFLKSVINNIPQGIYTSGKGSSAAGLTAAVRKEEVGGNYILEAGALVLGDKGLVAVDEFDKMKPEDRSALHEAMEQQSISIAKAGITATLNTRCSILAAANPKEGKFDPYKPIVTQVNLPPSILSRFDILFVMEDIPDPDRDKDIADYLLDIHEKQEIIYDIDPDMVKKYIAYARQHCHPVVSGKARDTLRDFYLEMRGMVDTETKQVPITVRQLEAMVRLTEASAKAHLRNVATIEDAERAVLVMRNYLTKVGMDPQTGKIDVIKVQGDKPHSWYQNVDKVVGILDELEDEFGGKLPSNGYIEKTVTDRLGVKGDDVPQLIKEAKWARPST